MSLLRANFLFLSVLELSGDLGNVLTLMKCLLKLELRGLARPVRCISPRTIGRSTAHLLHLEHPTTKCVAKGDEQHTVMC